MEDAWAAELAALRAEIEALRTEVGRCINVPESKNSSGTLDTFRKHAADAIIAGELARAKETLRAQAENCPAKEQCLPQFEKTLTALLGSLKTGSISAEEITKIRREYEDAQKLCRYEHCTGCLLEADKLFAAHTKLLKSAGVYAGDSIGEQIQELSDEAVVAWIGEPLANVIRVKILKSLASEPKSFADLGKLTGLRGGNLLFHLEKLLDAGMILQKGERKEYVLTGRGHELLGAAAVLMEKTG
ncbi:MAG TPA: winged helix-turn-helix domain-containing protein [Methanocorpusculum sp.]|nr:winged helix-turn-helix domain-containing protein [Methanocorpusculum sp.]